MWIIPKSRFIAVRVLILHLFCLISAKPTEGHYLKEWDHNSISRAENSSESSPIHQQNLEVEADLERQRYPIGVVKMSSDEGQKFFTDYWLFKGDSSTNGIKDLNKRRAVESEVPLNTSMTPAFRSLLLHQIEGPENQDFSFGPELKARSPAAVLATLQKRSFQCPTGTADCSDIGYPNSCCPVSDRCFAIEDTGLGHVGCCRKGINCGGTIRNCNKPNTACPSSKGGGCCVPNYICNGIGCVIDPTLVVTTVVTVTTMISSTSEIATITTTSIPDFPYTSNDQTCSKNLIGDSCPIDQTCTMGGNCIPLIVAPTSASFPATGDVPVRPTSLDSSLPSDAISDPTCPTGFYACEAFYVGGCCRTGRNCDTTSCPPRTSTSLIFDGVTIAVPVGTGASKANLGGSCADGWASCGLKDGGGCCPNGWKCGKSNCYDDRVTATATITKDNSSHAVKKNIEMINVITCSTLIMIVIMNIL